jgi:tetratricopeptide (TPR) repeat protein
MMAGRSAVSRFAYKQAISYFTNMFSDDCPWDLQVQANMAYADATISQDSTNKPAELKYAIQSLQHVIQAQSNSWQAAQAWGRIADCYFELGSKDPAQYSNASNGYRKVIDATAATGAARYEARFKMGDTIEKQAALATGEEQTVLLKQALTQYVDAFYQGLHDSDKPSPLWTKKSGLAAGQLAEELQEWQTAIEIYQHLKILVPVLAQSCDKKIAKAREHLL